MQVRKRALESAEMSQGARSRYCVRESSRQDCEVIFHVRFVKLASLSEDLAARAFLHHPAWRALRVEDEAQLFVRGFDADVFDVAASQTATTNEAIARRARPTYFHDKQAHAAAKLKRLPTMLALPTLNRWPSSVEI